MAACPNPKCRRPLEPDARFCTSCGTASTPAAVAGPPTRPAVVPTLPLPLLLGDRYQLIESCGGGGMAQVYRAIDQKFTREVAVKVINPSLRSEKEFDDRFHREASILGTLHDPHIIVAHDFGIDPTHGPYLVMEYLRGMSLKDRIRKGKLPVPVAVQIGTQVLLALQHAHDRGIVHRDIKPDNLFLVEQPGAILLVRVLDFGIARIYRADTPQQENQARITLPGAIIGTPKYMAPEQLAGESIDARADIYSLAVVLFESLTGQIPKLPYGPSLGDLCANAPPALEALLNECLRIDPSKRPPSAMAVFERLRGIRDAQGNPILNSGSHPALILPPVPPAPGDHTQRTGLVQKMGRRGLIAAGSLTALGCFAAWVLYQMLVRTGPINPPDRESVVGISVGMSRSKAIDALGKPIDVWIGSPWALPAKAHLGHVLTPADVPAEAEVLHWTGVCAVVAGDQVVAVVADESSDGTSGRGVRVGDSDVQLEKRYAEGPSIGNFNDPPESKVTPNWGMTYRYDASGIGFELRGHHVTAITLYQPR